MPVRWLVENVPLIDEVVETRIEAEGGSDTGVGVVMWSCERVVESSWEENVVRHHLLVWTPLNSTRRALLNHCLGRGPGMNYLHTRSTAVEVPAPIPIPDPKRNSCKVATSVGCSCGTAAFSASENTLKPDMNNHCVSTAYGVNCGRGRQECEDDSSQMSRMTCRYHLGDDPDDDDERS